MKKIFCAAIGLLVFALRAETPLLRVGVLTDTHVGKTEKSCRNIRQAFRFFAKEKVDLMVHLGDIADRHYPEGYRIIRRYFNEIFRENRPKELWLYANHDSIDRKGKPWEKELQEELQIPNKPFDKLELKGIPFLVFPQRGPLKKREEMIQQAIKDFPGKPVFVLDHILPYCTTENSTVWGNLPRRQMLDKYPQVIQLSGHSHNSLYNERCIWQGNFTTVNCGCLQVWGGDLVGTAPKSKAANEVMIVEIFPEKIIFRCYSLTGGQEIRPERPWTIPWPFDPATAPYNPVLRGKISPKPQFDQNAAVTMQADKVPFNKLSFSFPEAKHPEKCYRYTLTLKRKNAAGVWEALAVRECYGNFWKNPYDDKITVDFSAGYFEENTFYQLSIEPRNYYGGKGKALVHEFCAPRPKTGKVIYECKNPMEVLLFMTGQEAGEPVKKSGGFYLHPGGHARLIFPGGVWDGKAGTKFRFIADVAFEQPENSSWTAVLRDPAPPITYANNRISTPRRSSCQRIVIDFTKKRHRLNYHLRIGEGLPGKIAFRYVRIEKL